MAYTFMAFTNPPDAHLTLTPDSGATLVGTPATDAAGRQGQACTVPDATPNGHGATLELSANGKISQRLRGFLMLEDLTARLQVDDFTLADVPAPPVEPGPTPPPAGSSPEDIIRHVYDTTHPNLATAAGCGRFTEDVCDALHADHSPMWGHISKSEGQNQFNGHAVDAVMLLANAGSTTAGIYDIIYSSASPEAKPAFNFVEPPNYELWYYPAEALTRGVTMVAIPTLRLRR